MSFQKRPGVSEHTNRANDGDTPRTLSGATTARSNTVDVEKAVKGKRARILKQRQQWFGSDTENLYSPLVEFIAVSKLCFRSNGEQLMN
jgi:hypothetical protein